MSAEQRAAIANPKPGNAEDRQEGSNDQRKQRAQRPEVLLESIANDAERALVKAGKLDKAFQEIVPDIKAVGRKAEEFADKARKQRERFA